MEEKKRLVSLDVLRGFDMFWLVGGQATALAVAGLFNLPWLTKQFKHAEWEGFRFYDFIFPLFVFIVGMSVVFSLEGIVKENGKGAAYKKLLRRSVLLFLLGVFYYGGFSALWPEIRLMGVLQRLALCYLFTGMLFIHCNLRGLIIVWVSLLLGYWALLSFVPVPAFGETSFAPGANWANYIDSKWLPGLKYNGTWDPEGMLSTLPAICSCLLGVFATLLIKNNDIQDMKKVVYLTGGGAAFVIAGYMWGLQFPIIKNIWTSSYVLVAGGYSLFLMGFFYLIVDIWRFQVWAKPLIWLGMNPITIYMFRKIVGSDKGLNGLANRFVGANLQGLVDDSTGKLVTSVVALLISLWLVRWLYKRKIFLRI